MTLHPTRTPWGHEATVRDDAGWLRHVTDAMPTEAEAIAAAQAWIAGVGPLTGFGGRRQKDEDELLKEPA